MFAKKSVILLVLAIFVAWASVAMAADFPKKTVQLIVPYSAGGSTDRFARIVAKHAGKYLSQPCVVVNRTGGGGAVGVSYVVNAKPDGYTVLTGVLTHLFMHKTVPGVKFTLTNFKPLSMLADDQMYFGLKSGTRADLPLDKLVELAKQKPNEIVCGIGSNWGAFDLARIMFELQAGIKFRRVSFKGGAGTTKAILSGFADIMPIFAGDFGSHVEAGTGKWLAVCADKRMSQYPDTPTFKEYGFDVVWHQPRFFLAPAGTPDDVIKTLDMAFKKTFDDPAWRTEMEKGGFPILAYKGSNELQEFLVETLRQLDPPLSIMISERAKAAQ
jgi:tripartite-type tricarboxylate transporter receptor subunit TctC